jgi:hypothetical protein
MATKITAGFATPLETAERLGVPRRRAIELIKLVRSTHAVGRNGRPNGLKAKKGSVKRKLSKRQMRAKSTKAAR